MAPRGPYCLRRRFRDSWYDYDDLLRCRPLQPDQSRPFWASLRAFLDRAPSRRAFCSGNFVAIRELAEDFLVAEQDRAERWVSVQEDVVGCVADDEFDVAARTLTVLVTKIFENRYVRVGGQQQQQQQQQYHHHHHHHHQQQQEQQQQQQQQEDEQEEEDMMAGVASALPTAEAATAAPAGAMVLAFRPALETEEGKKKIE